MEQQEQRFLEWLREGGTEIHEGIQLHQFEGMGRGLIATQDIEPETLLFSLPRTLLLNTSTSQLPSLLPIEDYSQLSGWTPLILTMMYEYLHPSISLWTPYFALMPKPQSFNSLMYWSEDQLNELKGSLVLTKIGKEEAEEDWENTLKPFIEKYESVLGKKEEYTLELFHWMGSLILSRSFHVESSGKTDDDEDSDDDDDEEEERENVNDVAMVPMADILNALSGKDNARLFYEPTTLNMTSTSFIPSGTQIFNTYADPPNSDLLRRYGHVDEINGADLVEISLETVVDLVGEKFERWGDEKVREERAEWLLEVGIDDTFPLDQTYEIPEDLISCIRAFVASEKELEKALRKGQPPKAKMDEEVAGFIKELLERREREYETSVEEDEKLLNAGGLEERKRMAIVVRLGEKRILKQARETLEAEYPAPPATTTDGKKRGHGEEEKETGKGGKKQKRN